MLFDEVKSAYAIYSQLNRECIHKEFLQLFDLSVIHSFLAQIYIQVLWYSCTLFIMQFLQCQKFTLQSHLRTLHSFSTVRSNGLHLDFPISVCLPFSFLFLCFFPIDLPLCTEVESKRPEHSHTMEGLLSVCFFKILPTYFTLKFEYKYCTFILYFIFRNKK